MVSASACAGHDDPHSKATILVVEDDVLIRAATAKFLRSSGYHVVEAMDVEGAENLLGAVPVHLVFADISLAGQRSGLDLLEIVRRKHPGVKVLLASGVVRAEDVAHTGAPFIRKPYFLFDVERRIVTLLHPPH